MSDWGFVIVLVKIIFFGLIVFMCCSRKRRNKQQQMVAVQPETGTAAAAAAAPYTIPHRSSVGRWSVSGGIGDHQGGANMSGVIHGNVAVMQPGTGLLPPTLTPEQQVAIQAHSFWFQIRKMAQSIN